MPSPSGGLCVGYEISGILPLSASDWTLDGDSVGGIEGRGPKGLLLRVNVGGGGYSGSKNAGDKKDK